MERTKGLNRCCLRFIKQNLLLFFILLGVAAGITLGICLRVYVPAFQQPNLYVRHIHYLYFPAEIFLRVMMFITLPLLVSSLVSGIGSLDIKSSGKIGLYVFGYYILTTVIAIVEGFIYVYAIRPGANANSNNTTNITDSQGIHALGANRMDSFLDMIRNMFPDNIITAAFQVHKTSVSYKDLLLAGNNASIQVEQFETEKVDGINVLGITLWSIIFSITLAFTGNKGKPVFILFETIFETTMKMIRVLLWVYPVGIMFMLATTVVQLQDPLDTMQKASLFIVASLAGLFTHTFIVLPLLFFVCVRKNPYTHMMGCLRAIVTAFVTSNSAMALPLTMTCCKRLGYKESVIRFMAPVGAVINMDGTALYQAIAPIFMARFYGMNPGPIQVLILGMTAVAVSFGAPNSPDSMVLYIIMFQSIGLPLKDIGMLLTFDWILSKFRTAVNVAGDCFGVAIVQKLTDSKRNDDNGKESDETEEAELSYLNKTLE